MDETHSPAGKLYAPLTKRERDILALLAQDLTDREIAARLFLANTTVRWYNRQIYNKLGVENRVQAVELGKRLGLLGKSDRGETAFQRPKHNLPAQLTPFVGRIRELDDLTRLLSQFRTRLVTLLAVGGMGKTRLALAAAELLQPQFSDGIYFVPLAPLTTADQIISAIAEACGFQFAPDMRTPKQQVLDFLRAKSVLLVLDNFEHLLEGATLVSDVLQAASQLTLLVTSRERLHLSSETVYSLYGLPYPEKSNAEDVSDYAAVQLFLGCALRAQPHFVVTDTVSVIHICQLVQGMPLGIELAASWVASLSTQEIAQEIERSADFLQTTMRDVPERLRSVRAVLEATWSRLTKEEQSAFCKLSVFRGGCTREAAQAVAGADINSLTGLVDKALLWRNAQTGRFDIHELLRQFAEAKLKLEPEQEHEAYLRHSNFFARLLGAQTQALIDSRTREAIRLITADLENIRQAWQGLVEDNNWTAFEYSWEALFLFFEYTGQFQDGISFFSSVVEQSEQIVGENKNYYLHVTAMMAFSWFTFFAGNVLLAKELIEKALKGVETARLSDPRLLAYVFHCQVCYLWALNEGERALRQSYRVLEIATQTGRRYYHAMAHFDLGLSFYQLKNYEQAREHLSQTVAICTATQHVMGIGHASCELARVFEVLGNYREANRLLEQSLATFLESGDHWGSTNALVYLGRVTNNMGQHKEAAGYLYQVLNITLEHNMPHQTAATLTEFAPLLASVGQILLGRSILQFLQFHALGWPETQQRVEQYLGQVTQIIDRDIQTNDKQENKLTTLDEVINSILVNQSLFQLD